MRARKAVRVGSRIGIRLFGSAPISGCIFELQKFRCSSCQTIYTAALPPEAGLQKYHETAGSTNVLMRYGAGMPWFRLAWLQLQYGIPLPPATQWDICERVANKLYPVYRLLMVIAAQLELFHHDDTGATILALLRQEEGKGKERTGVYTTGVLAIGNGLKIALFITSNRHAGENLASLLAQRSAELGTPIQMSDGEAKNSVGELKTNEANCLTHARRKFVDELPNYREECEKVIDTLAEIYKNEDFTKEQKMTPEQRLEYHKARSKTLLDDLRKYLLQLVADKKVEPNSDMGKAISYVDKRWDKLTLFLRVPGAPLDNNPCERLLKRAILHRKNSLFYKTEHGALIGDICMSIINTCALNGVDPFDYLTELQRHHREVRKKPELWLPWNYREQLQESAA
jgi:transposase